MNHKREITDHAAVEELFFNNIWQQESEYKLYSLKRLLHGIAWFCFNLSQWKVTNYESS